MKSYNMGSSVSGINILNVHPCCIMHQYFIPFYGCIIHHCMGIPYLFIHSFVDGLKDCFHLLDTINNAVMSICVQVLSGLFFLRFFFFFLMWTIFKLFIEFVTILLLFFYVLVFLATWHVGS